MASVKFIEYKGKKILYENYSDSKPAEIFLLLENSKKIISSQSEGIVAALVNVKNTKFDRTVSGAMKDFVKANAPFIKVSAVYGMEEPISAIFSDGINFTERKNLKIFNDIDLAQDYPAGF